MSNAAAALGVKKERQYVPADFIVTDWAALEPFYSELLERPLPSLAAVQQWLRDRSELDSVVSEEYRWRYINMTRDTRDLETTEKLQFYYKELDPKLNTYNFQLNQKLVASPFIDELEPNQYFIYLRNVRKQIELYREENLPLFKELKLKENEYASITGNMEVVYQGKTLTLQQASKFLKNPDRNVREEVYRIISERRHNDQQKLDDLFDELIKLRHQVALNAGFDNYRDYKFASMGRFDYTPDDCTAFHNSVAEVVAPVVVNLVAKRKDKLGVDPLRPWDLDVDTEGKQALKPYEDGTDLTNKTIGVLDSVDHYFAQCLSNMKEHGYLDLDSRSGKAPGGYNMTLPETGSAFIFMNSAGSDRDVKTMVHEAGHAVHSFLSHQQELMYFRQYPSEVAELASMSMELFTMPHWSVFYADSEELKQSQKLQLEGILKVLPWIAIIDKFQHWIYTNPTHTQQQRKDTWLAIYREFHVGDPTDWNGLEEHLAYMWHKQLHLFEVPFYYIEYGMAQLGAVAMWRQMLQHGHQAIDNYKAALALGYTRPIGEIYSTAGVEFRFDKEYINELVSFLLGEYGKYEN
jgi:oligoendopeptidase F